MDEEMKSDPAYNPPAEVVEKCEVYLDLGDKTDLYNQLWEKVRSTDARYQAESCSFPLFLLPSTLYFPFWGIY